MCFASRCNIRGGGEVSIPLKKTCVSLLGASLNGDGVFVFFFLSLGTDNGKRSPAGVNGPEETQKTRGMKINHTLEMVFPL